jgi:dihydroorotate dehydrogenase
MSYNLLQKLLLTLEPELSHSIALNLLYYADKLGLLACLPQAKVSPQVYMGLTFPNKVGLAAGMDKNGDYIDALAALRFGFIEIGTVTPQPQLGNPKPRIFRLPEQQAIINCLGFNNKGIDYVVQKIKTTKFKGVLGVNIGKNASTPITEAIADYHYCFDCAAPYASYITINISSPNTAQLRKLQYGDLLLQLLSVLKAAQSKLLQQKNKYVPLVVKIAPDLTMHELQQLATALSINQIDAVIATNTTLARPQITEKHVGGLSGKPLYPRSTAVIRILRKLLPPEITIIASGGITSMHHAAAKLKAGADLIQIYTGLIYQGPFWPAKLIKSLA